MVLTLLSLHSSLPPSPPLPPSLASSSKGITSIETDIEAKKVIVVHAEDKVKATDILAALQKWGKAAGKEVALA